MGETERTNVTVALPADLVREARHLAVDRNMSLSKYLTLLLEEHVESRRRYRAARERQTRALAEGYEMGTHGQPHWTREDLHDRGA